MRCVRLAKMAQHHGAAVVITHMYDGPVARAAAAELALACDALGIRIKPCGLAAHPFLSLWPMAHLASLTEHFIIKHVEPGLGLTWQEEFGD